MMPGDTQSSALPIAADATVGTCQNCAVLHQNLNEYVSSFLALKQKIAVSDDSIRLQQTLEELQIRLVTLEKKTADYESLQAELEEKQDALKTYTQMSEEFEKLKQENGRTLTEKQILEDQLKDAKELTETQSLENAKLMREKAVVENDLLKTQTLLKKSQEQADQVEKLKEENANIINTKSRLETKVTQLEDSICKQNNQIAQLSKEKNQLERKIDDLQVRLIKLEKEKRKEYKSTSTQAVAPKEPKVDKEKIRMLLEGLWACVETQQQDSENQLHFRESRPKQIRLPSPQHEQRSSLSYTSPSATHTSRETCSFPAHSDPTLTRINPPGSTPTSHQAHLPSQSAKKEKHSPKKEHKNKQPLEDFINSPFSLEDVMTLFKPMPSCISPLQDLEAEIESMEIDKGEKENHLLPASTSISPQKKESVVITLESKCENSPAAPIQGSSDLLVATTQSKEQNSSGNVSIDVEANEMSGITITNGNHSTDEEMHHDMQTEQESAALDVSPSLSSSTSDKMGLCKVLSAEKSQQTPKTPPELCEPEDASVILEDDQSEFVPKMDISLSAQNVDKTPIVVGGESPKGNDKTEQKGNALSGTPNCSLSAVTEMREAVNEEQTSHLDSGLRVGSRDVSVLKAQEDECLDADADMQNMVPAMSSDSDGKQTASKTIAEQRLGNVPMTQKEGRKEEDGKDAGETSCTVTFRSESPVDAELKVKDGEKESVQGKLETLSKAETSVAESLEDSSASPGSQETETINCKSLKASTHSICRRLSPVCLFPTVTVQGLEGQPSPENHQIAVSISPHKNTLWSESNCKEDGNAQKATLKDSPQETKSKSRRKKCRSSTVSPAPSVMTRAATKNKESKKGRNSTEGVEKQCPQIVGEEDPDAVADLASAQAEYLGMVHSDMGPPLPRLLTPLTTPPKVGKSIHPRQAIGKLSFPSPMEGTSSPSTPTQSNGTPTGQQPSSSSLNSPLHPNGVPSSPLQFGSATPKHAVPVPGRLPLTAMSSPSSSSSPSQENSMRILDTMYPELSAHGRTLSILRGNVSLGICSSASGTSPVASISQVSCFKTVNSTSTAFTKADARGTKRHIDPFPEPTNSKCVRVGDGSDAATRKQAPSSSSDEDTASPLTSKLNQLAHGTATTSADDREHSEEKLIEGALQKIEQQCFDLLPVIQSHLYVGNKPKKPVLRSEEIEVISEVCQNSMPKADGLICAILNKLKTGRRELDTNCIQALCRVYTGICRQRNDWEKARVLAYSILTEDFPDAAKLILFMVTTWPGLLTHRSSLCQAIHAVTKLKAEKRLLSCLSAFLGWEKNPPCDIDQLISKTLSDIQSGSDLSFTKHSRYGDDLGAAAWERVLTLHLLCSHKKWKWTYEHVLGNKLWPLMNAWVAQPRDKQSPISDATVATVLRLIGRLSQLGIREQLTSSVLTVANVINTFGRHASAEGVPWKVQLSAIYCIHDLSPTNPKEALGAMAEWRGETTGIVPPAVTSCINQLASVCRQVRS
ncbi:little elongation complex subunit 1 isoform X1 [Takifugu rubripes]|nr:little elongation complex subunit 1 isoform X1 [Takifugu rubripes]